MRTSKCEFSSIRIPNDPKYATAAAIYVSEIAKMIGMQMHDLQSLENGITEAITALIGYSFEPGEKENLEIRCERTPAGLQVSLRDKGLPFGRAGMDSAAQENSSDDSPEMGEPVFRLKEYFDEIQFHNLGPQGKELILIKHLKNKSITDYYAACDLEPYQPSVPPMPVSAAQAKCGVRQMASADAPEVSKTIYKTYGYTYPRDYVYYPEKIVDLNKSGQIFSAVAIAGENQIAGYGVFQVWEENPQIVEMAQGVVKPEFRSRGCFRQITHYLLDRAKSMGIRGAFGEAVTNHTVSQHTTYGFGFRDCGLRLGLVPPGTEFKGMDGKIPHRVSLLVHFLFLQPPPEPLPIYAPPHHRDMIAAIYKELGVAPDIKDAVPDPAKKAASKSVFKIKLVGSMNFARIMLTRCGDHIAEELKIKVKELCLKKIEIVNLFLNLSDPLTYIYTAQFEKLGFFFAGILPAGFADGDALILQYLNNVPIDYSAIQVESALAAKLLTYVREQDPNIK
jgi:anti-sigma regulatory factor (Ser/Thr protein kinase)/ribosomal protein S18 acetylase RimI-like enzyme